MLISPANSLPLLPSEQYDAFVSSEVDRLKRVRYANNAVGVQTGMLRLVYRP